LFISLIKIVINIVSVLFGLDYTKEYKEGLARYGKLGIGMIHRNNLQEVENAVNAALYLTRPDKPDGSYQRLKVSLPNMKAFGQSRPKD